MGSRAGRTSSRHWKILAGPSLKWFEDDLGVHHFRGDFPHPSGAAAPEAADDEGLLGSTTRPTALVEARRTEERLHGIVQTMDKMEILDSRQCAMGGAKMKIYAPGSLCHGWRRRL